MRHLSRTGFSLIELLVVLVVVAVLAAILMPALRIVRTQARIADCASRLSAIGMAATTYASDYHGLYPPSFSNPNTWMWLHIGVGLTRPHGLGFLTSDYLGQRRDLLACPEVNLNNAYGNYATVEAFTRLYTGYRYVGNAYSDSGITWFITSDTNSARGPKLLPGWSLGMNNPGAQRVPLAYDTIAESSDPKQVFHPHPRDDIRRPAGISPQVEGGNVLFVDLHVGILPGPNWIQNGPYGRYIPWRM